MKAKSRKPKTESRAADRGIEAVTNPQRVDEVFRGAVELALDERAEYLVGACGGDAELRREVEELLRHDEVAGADFLAPPVLRQLATGERGRAEEPDPLIGTDVGRCHITGFIAAGGMGNVYQAVQQRPRRTVAVKIMNRGLVSRSGLRRFEHESQILAHLRHPNIAQVYEAGTHRVGRAPGVPYFVMEYIAGAESITEYSRERGLSLRDRLRLFVKICDAVHHGHQKGIIHRDLKPGNILIDSDGEPKVIDFGVARSTDADVALTTACTDVGQLVGTLQYMSPEQCAGDPREIDTRSDVFSLGVVLYELLSGRVPYEVGGVPVYEATRIVREKVPDRPSAIDRRLRGDLETIVLKAVEKDREARYQSAADLGRDIERYLNGEPIDARPPTLWTQAMRWAMGHPRAATTAVCLFIAFAVLGGTWAATKLLHYRAHEVVIVNDGEAARLVAWDGRVIKSWTHDERLPYRVRFGKLVKQPAEMGGRHLAVIGFADAWGASPFPNSLCAYDVKDDLENPLWERHIDDGDIPEEVRRERGFAGAEFRCVQGAVADAFPELAGQEIIAIHQHESFTHSAIRVYGLSGVLLYQVWVDASVQAVYWMSDPGLIVLAGLNGAAYWPERGHAEVRFPHASVVFAIRPEVGFIVRKYLKQRAGEGPLMAAWYKCVMPPDVSDTLHTFPASFVSPGGRFDRAQFVAFSMVTRDLYGGQHGGIEWVLDASGRIVPGTMKTNDVYAIHRLQLPKPEDVYLGDLPGVVGGE